MRTERFELRGLTFHVTFWDPQHAPTGTTFLLLHGFADAGGSFDLVAPRLAARGHAVVAPDLRGFGQTSWISCDGYYHFFDYVGDVDALVARLDPARLFLVGHSMGGTIATIYAGARPKRIHRLALLEGLGPPDNDPTWAPDRCAKWLDDLAKEGGRGPQKAMATEEEALGRLAMQHAAVPREVLASRLPYLLARKADGGFSWRFDPLHRTTSPQPFYASQYKAFAKRITCPVLFVGGGKDGFHPPDEAERIGCFAHASRVEIEGAGHMMHWTRPEETAAALLGHV